LWDAFLASLDAFVFPTTYTHEAEPLVVLEALSAGVPIAAFGRGCIGRMVPSSAGLVVEVGDDFIDRSLPFLLDLACGSFSSDAMRRGARVVFEEQVAQAGRDRAELIDLMLCSS